MDRDLMAELANFRITEWIAEEKARRQTSAPAIPADRRVITISRQYGAGGHAIAELAANLLGPQWHIWDKEIVDEVAKSAKVRTSLVSALDEHSQSRLEEILRYVSNRWDVNPEHYYKHLVEVLLALAQQGDKIIVGRGANFVLRHALRVRLCATEPYRMRTIMKREGFTDVEAKARIASVEADRSGFISSFFHHDVNDPTAYDLIINVDRVGNEAAAVAIVGAMEAICAGVTHHDVVGAALRQSAR